MNRRTLLGRIAATFGLGSLFDRRSLAATTPAIPIPADPPTPTYPTTIKVGFLARIGDGSLVPVPRRHGLRHVAILPADHLPAAGSNRDVWAEAMTVGPEGQLVSTCIEGRVIADRCDRDGRHRLTIALARSPADAAAEVWPGHRLVDVMVALTAIVPASWLRTLPVHSPRPYTAADWLAWYEGRWPVA